MDKKFHGYWKLLKWQTLIDHGSPNFPFGENAQGQLLYTDKNKVYATLMRPDRPDFEIPYLSKGTAIEQKKAIEGYISYSGNFEITKDTVSHHVAFSLLPNWIGKTLERVYEFSPDFNHLKLSTMPIVTSKGHQVIQELFWERE